MTDAACMTGLLRLMSVMSPAFPIGAFAYSGGLEKAVEDGLVGDAASLRIWAQTLLAHGGAWNDALLLAESHRAAADGARLSAVAELAEALAGSRERHQETMALGEGFLAAAAAWPQPDAPALPTALAYPVAVGAVAARLAVPLSMTLAAFLHAGLSQIASAGIRLNIMGQRQGLVLLAESEPLLLSLAARAEAATLDDLGTAAVQADIAGLRHETQRVRLFRS